MPPQREDHEIWTPVPAKKLNAMLADIRNVSTAPDLMEKARGHIAKAQSSALGKMNCDILKMLCNEAGIPYVAPKANAVEDLMSMVRADLLLHF